MTLRSVQAHSDLAQVTSRVLFISFLGSSIGFTIAGGIYTHTFKPALKHYLGSAATPTLVDTVFSSITGDIPAPGTTEEEAIDNAYSKVLQYITFASLTCSIMIVFFTLLLPDLRLRDDHNLIAAHERIDGVEESERRERDIAGVEGGGEGKR